MKLPAEIRNCIYTFAVTEPDELHLHTAIPPPLGQVSRQIRDEVLPIFLKTNDFAVLFSKAGDGHDVDFSPVTIDWLVEVGLRVPLFHNITILLVPGAKVGRGCSRLQPGSYRYFMSKTPTSFHYTVGDCRHCAADGFSLFEPLAQSCQAFRKFVDVIKQIHQLHKSFLPLRKALLGAEPCFSLVEVRAIARSLDHTSYRSLIAQDHILTVFSTVYEQWSPGQTVYEQWSGEASSREAAKIFNSLLNPEIEGLKDTLWKDV